MPKDKKDKKDKKKDKARDKVKEMAGLKLPRKLRKAGNIAMDLAREPVVSEVVAAALLSAASALRGNQKTSRAAGEAMIKGATESTKQASKVGDALRDLAIDLARRTLDNWDRAEPAKGGKTKR
jgi:hypothetical protein